MNSTFFEGMTDEEKLAKLPQYIAIMQSMLKESYERNTKNLYRVRFDDGGDLYETAGCYVTAKDEDEVIDTIRKMLENSSLNPKKHTLYFTKDNTRFHSGSVRCGGNKIELCENRKDFLRLINELKYVDISEFQEHLIIEKVESFDLGEKFVTDKY